MVALVAAAGPRVMFVIARLFLNIGLCLFIVIIPLALATDSMALKMLDIIFFLLVATPSREQVKLTEGSSTNVCAIAAHLLRPTSIAFH